MVTLEFRVEYKSNRTTSLGASGTTSRTAFTVASGTVDACAKIRIMAYVLHREVKRYRRVHMESRVECAD